MYLCLSRRVQQQWLLLLCLLFALVCANNAEQDEYWLDVEEVVLAPNGVRRPVLAFNRSIPGPVLRAKSGRGFVLHVRNLLDRPTGIHFHGLLHQASPQYDGAVGVTQCPIPPGETFTYRFPIHAQAGTYWYHAHYQSQYPDGLAGMLIIDPDSEDPHASLYDEERVVVLSDWYNTPMPQLLRSFLSPESRGDEPMPDSALINGRGRFDCPRYEHSLPPLLDVNTTSDLFKQIYVNGSRCIQDPVDTDDFDLVPGKRYRFRIINVSALSGFKLGLDYHRLTVIEADGVNVYPRVVDSIELNVGQRYSVIIHANQTRSSEYTLRTILQTKCFPKKHSKMLSPLTTALVRYDPVAASGKKNSFWRKLSYVDFRLNRHLLEMDDGIECDHLFDDTLVPLEPFPLPDENTLFQTIVLNVTFGADEKGIDRGYINNQSYFPSKTLPLLHSVIQGTPLDKTANAIELPKAGIVQIILNNFDDGEHPFHLHGHTFAIRQRGVGAFIPPSNTSYHTWFANSPPPMRRDTVTVPPNGHAVLQFYSNNPGVWIFHCHIEWHMEVGLAVNFVELPEILRSSISIPDPLKQLCPQ